MNWERESNYDRIIKFVTFLILPIFSLLYSLKRIKTKSSFTIAYLFSLLFGLSFVVDDSRGYDSSHYRDMFENYQLISFYNFKESFYEYISFEGVKKDFYFDTLSFFLSRFTSNYHIMFLFASSVFSFFALKSLKHLVLNRHFDNSLASYILLYLFLFNQLFNINGLRMWTAAWIAVYAIFEIFKNSNYKYFLILLLTPFFHGSFWIVVGIVFIAIFLKKYRFFFTITFFLSFVVGTLAFELINNFSYLLPYFMQKMIKGYTDPDYIELRNQVGDSQTSIFKHISGILVNIYINVIVFLFIKNYRIILKNNKTKNLFLFLLIYMTFTNATMGIPSLGGRFVILAYPLIAYIWLENFKGKKYNYILYILPIVFFFKIFEQIILYKNVLGFEFIIGNPFYLIYEYVISSK